MPKILNYKNFTYLGISILICAMFFNTTVASTVVKNEVPNSFYQIKLQSNNNVTDSNLNLSPVNMSNSPEIVSGSKWSNYTEDLNRAIHLYDLALKSDPNNPDILTNKGIVLSLLGEQKQAIAVYNIALKINPKHVGALFNKAIVLNMTGNFTGATYYFKEASEIDSSYKGELINIKSLAQALKKSESKLEPRNATHCKDSESVNKQRLCLQN
jgi:tetratricopeptide (TPR) repeat protein